MRWTEEELEYLKENYPTKKAMRELAEHLGRTEKAIKHKAVRLELFRPIIPTNRPKNKRHRNIYDKNYYEKHKEIIYQKKQERFNKRKLGFIQKLGGKCKFCGYHKCPWALDFHHDKSDKEDCISRIIKNFSKEKALKEAMKCILLCANCHRELHFKIKHGDII